MVVHKKKDSWPWCGTSAAVVSCPKSADGADTSTTTTVRLRSWAGGRRRPRVSPATPRAPTAPGLPLLLRVTRAAMTTPAAATDRNPCTRGN